MISIQTLTMGSVIAMFIIGGLLALTKPRDADLPNFITEWLISRIRANGGAVANVFAATACAQYNRPENITIKNYFFVKIATLKIDTQQVRFLGIADSWMKIFSFSF